MDSNEKVLYKEIDLLSLHGTPLHLVSLTFDEEDFPVDNKFLKKIPRLRKIVSEIEACAKGNAEAEMAIKQIVLEMEKANIIY